MTTAHSERAWLQKAVAARSWQDGRLEELWQSHAVSLVLVQADGQIQRSSPAFLVSHQQLESMPWGSQTLRIGRLPTPRVRGLLLKRQQLERQETESRIHPYLPEGLLQPEIESLQRRGLSLRGDLSIPPLTQNGTWVGERVLRELLTNACKYAQPREVEIIWREVPAGWELVVVNPVA